MLNRDQQSDVGISAAENLVGGKKVNETENVVVPKNRVKKIKSQGHANFYCTKRQPCKID